MGAKEDGEVFLAENAKNDYITVTASGLQYEILKEGNGAKPAGPQSTVEVNYRGTFIDGKEFDSSFKRGETIEFQLNQVIAGWTEGVQLMNIGSRYRFYIPYQLGYGERGAGGVIPPYSALIFEVDLISVTD